MSRSWMQPVAVLDHERELRKEPPVVAGEHPPDLLPRLGASLITLWEEGPLVAFTMTHPDAKNRGLATALIARSVAALRDAGFGEIRLAVTDGNAPAIHVYEKLGFTRAGPVVPPPR